MQHTKGSWIYMNHTIGQFIIDFFFLFLGTIRKSLWQVYCKRANKSQNITKVYSPAQYTVHH